jgi:hypothetical protein
MRGFFMPKILLLRSERVVSWQMYYLPQQCDGSLLFFWQVPEEFSELPGFGCCARKLSTGDHTVKKNKKIFGNMKYYI